MTGPTPPPPITLEDQHRLALARELTYAAGVPLRDRYGFAASDEDVHRAVAAVFEHPDDEVAALRPLAQQRRDAAVRGLS